MSITTSIEEYIGQRFDKLYETAKLEGFDISYELQLMLDNLEADVIQLSKQKSTTEAEELQDAAWEHGYDWGYDKGYAEGCVKGYEKGYREGTLENE
jgi:flagellar biosynthesis/type III secretory pathway protein FliH